MLSEKIIRAIIKNNLEEGLRSGGSIRSNASSRAQPKISSDEEETETQDGATRTRKKKSGFDTIVLSDDEKHNSEILKRWNIFANSLTKEDFETADKYLSPNWTNIENGLEGFEKKLDSTGYDIPLALAVSLLIGHYRKESERGNFYRIGNSDKTLEPMLSSRARGAELNNIDLIAGEIIDFSDKAKDSDRLSDLSNEDQNKILPLYVQLSNGISDFLDNKSITSSQNEFANYQQGDEIVHPYVRAFNPLFQIQGAIDDLLLSFANGMREKEKEEEEEEKEKEIETKNKALQANVEKQEVQITFLSDTFRNSSEQTIDFHHKRILSRYPNANDNLRSFISGKAKGIYDVISNFQSGLFTSFDFNQLCTTIAVIDNYLVSSGDSRDDKTKNLQILALLISLKSQLGVVMVDRVLDFSVIDIGMLTLDSSSNSVKKSMEDSFAFYTDKKINPILLSYIPRLINFKNNLSASDTLIGASNRSNKLKLLSKGIDAIHKLFIAALNSSGRYVASFRDNIGSKSALKHCYWIAANYHKGSVDIYKNSGGDVAGITKFKDFAEVLNWTINESRKNKKNIIREAKETFDMSKIVNFDNKLSSSTGYAYFYVGPPGPFISIPEENSSGIRYTSLYELIYYFDVTKQFPNEPKNIINYINFIRKQAENNGGFDINNLGIIKIDQLKKLNRSLRGDDNASPIPSALNTIATTTASPYALAPPRPALENPTLISSADEITFLNWLYDQDYVGEALASQQIVSAIVKSLNSDDKTTSDRAKKIVNHLNDNQDNVLIGDGDASSAKTWRQATTMIDEADEDSINKVKDIYRTLMSREYASDSRSISGLKSELTGLINKGGSMDNLDNLKSNYPYFQKAFKNLVLKKQGKDEIDFSTFQAIITDWERIGSSVSIGNNIDGLHQYVRRISGDPDVKRFKAHTSAATTSGLDIYPNDFNVKIHGNPASSVPARLATLNPAQLVDAEVAMKKFSNLLKGIGNTIKKPLKITMDFDASGNFNKSRIQGRLGSAINIGLKRMIKRELSRVYEGSTAAGLTITLTFPAARYLESN